MLPKSLHQRQRDDADVEDGSSPEMWDISTKCLFPPLSGCNAEHRVDYQNIRMMKYVTLARRQMLEEQEESNKSCGRHGDMCKAHCDDLSWLRSWHTSMSCWWQWSGQRLSLRELKIPWIWRHGLESLDNAGIKADFSSLGSFPIHVISLTCLILCKFCASNHSSYELWAW